MVQKISKPVWVEAGELKFGMDIGYALLVQTLIAVSDLEFLEIY
jgi:hypothetical protein